MTFQLEIDVRPSKFVPSEFGISLILLAVFRSLRYILWEFREEVAK